MNKISKILFILAGILSFKLANAATIIDNIGLINGDVEILLSITDNITITESKKNGDRYWVTFKSGERSFSVNIPSRDYEKISNNQKVTCNTLPMPNLTSIVCNNTEISQVATYTIKDLLSRK
ncbi:MAG: hypothetical protein J0G32_04255 [Alphaproteobacteria bacterium]|nr:hypothetical protein [Alphaproteobacteria bacterium]OJV13847.1 MAG: hypothetical protein BGO27_08110 [Alphaproteobacteria bacterium 33-17]